MWGTTSWSRFADHSVRNANYYDDAGTDDPWPITIGHPNIRRPCLRSYPPARRARRSDEIWGNSGLAPGRIASADMRESPEPNRISLMGAWEPDYWTHKLGVSNGELMRIIGKVGNSATVVRKELGLVTPKNQARPKPAHTWPIGWRHRDFDRRNESGKQRPRPGFSRSNTKRSRSVR